MPGLAWRKENSRLMSRRIREIHEANYFAYGSRRMWKALLGAGERIGRSRVERHDAQWHPGRQAA